MMYFVQFYHREQLIWDRKREVTIFKNALSSVWKRIEGINHGPFVWIDMDNEDATFDYPSGIAFCSVYYKSELFRVLRWAKQRPDVEFHIGGPIVDTWPLSKEIEDSLPNFRSHYKLLFEDFLFEQKFAPLAHWDLKLPETDAPEIAYGFSVSKLNGCWWRKCTYCKQKSLPIYLNPTEIPIIDYPGTKHIWLNTYCMRAQDIKNIYPNLPDRDDVRYGTFLKLNYWSTEYMLRAIETMKCNPKNLAFDIGIEFPIARVLEIANRGVSLPEYINGLNLLLEYGCKIHINLIQRLGFLKESDIDDVKLFAECISHNDMSNLSASIFRLHISPERPMWDYLMDQNVYIKKAPNDIWDADIYNVYMTDEQLEIDNKILEIYKSLNMDYLWNSIPEGE